MRSRHLPLLVLLLATTLARASFAGPTCNAESIAALSGVAPVTAHYYANEPFTAPLAPGAVSTTTYSNLLPFCRVTANIKTSETSSINIEVWMPDPGWNQKYLGTGNGGYAGAIVYDALADGLNRHYAVANTDMGTAPGPIAGGQIYAWLNGSSLVGQKEKWNDWGHRSTHAMTVAAKKIIKAFYGGNPKQSYFLGCSTGGQQGLVQAQSYAEDYDGIVAGAPGNNRTHLIAAFYWSYRATRLAPNSFIPLGKIVVLNQKVLAACGTQAGALQGDGFLADPRKCTFEPKQLLCAGADAPTCLTAPQVEAMARLYTGPVNPSNKRLIYPGWPRGSEGLPANWIILEGDFFDVLNNQWATIPDPAFHGMFRWVFNAANWHWQDFTFDAGMAKVDTELGDVVNALATDLQAFKRRNGKLILYHGWADAIVAAQDTINYYNRVIALQGNSPSQSLSETLRFARLFLAPGMGHCTGGPGPSIFNGAGNYGPNHDPQHDILSALDRWVIDDVAPERIIATRPAIQMGGQKFPLMTRPLCPYPLRAQYKGEPADKNDASSFVCVKGEQLKDQVPAPEYQK